MAAVLKNIIGELCHRNLHICKENAHWNLANELIADRKRLSLLPNSRFLWV